jgi:hypothetical protein
MRAAQDTKRLNPDPYQTKSRPISYLPLPFRETLCLYIEDQATRPEEDEKRKLHAEEEGNLHANSTPSPGREIIPTHTPSSQDLASFSRLEKTATKHTFVSRRRPREKSTWCAP